MILHTQKAVHLSTLRRESEMVALLRGSEIEVKAVEWLWKPMIPFGDVTIVQGDGGDGKTTMMLTIAAKLSKGVLPPSLEDGLLVDA